MDAGKVNRQLRKQEVNAGVGMSRRRGWEGAIVSDRGKTRGSRGLMEDRGSMETGQV